MLLRRCLHAGVQRPITDVVICRGSPAKYTASSAHFSSPAKQQAACWFVPQPPSYRPCQCTSGDGDSAAICSAFGPLE